MAGIKLVSVVNIDSVYDLQSPTGKNNSKYKWYKEQSTVKDSFSNLNWNYVGCNEDVYALVSNYGGSSGPSCRYIKFLVELRSNRYEFSNDTAKNFIKRYGTVQWETTGNQVMTNKDQTSSWNPFLCAQAAWPRESSGTGMTKIGVKEYSIYANASNTTTKERTWSTDEPNPGTWSAGSSTAECLSYTDKIVKTFTPSDYFPVAVLDYSTNEYMLQSNPNSVKFYYDETKTTGALTKTTTYELTPKGTYTISGHWWASGGASEMKNVLEYLFAAYTDKTIYLTDIVQYGGWTTNMIIETKWGIRMTNHLTEKAIGKVPTSWNNDNGLDVGTGAGIPITKKLPDAGKITVNGKCSEAGYLGIYTSAVGDYNWGITNRTTYTSKFTHVAKDTPWQFSDIPCLKNDFCFIVFIPDTEGATIDVNSIALTKEN